jgi:ribonuclease BN (tRNA processing enzyme)
MRFTTFGGCGAWPAAGRACSGYLVEQDGFRVLIDPGYSVLPRLLEQVPADALDAVLITHGHPDHCADLNPLLRARAMSDDPPAALPVYAPDGALDVVLALDRPGMLDDAVALRSFDPGERFAAGPFEVCTFLLPHWVPNAGLRLESASQTFAYTGDCGPSPDLIPLAASADVFLAEATYPRSVPEDSVRYLSSARDAGRTAARAGVGRLVLTHLWPGTSPAESVEAAAAEFGGQISVAGQDE